MRCKPSTGCCGDRALLGGGDISVEAKGKGGVVSFHSRLGTPKNVDLVQIHFVAIS